MTLWNFAWIIVEICIYYRVNIQPPDDNGMIFKSPSKHSSFVKSIPINQGESFENNKPMLSNDNSVDENIIRFKDQKVLYIMLNFDNKEEPRPSCVMERKFSSNPADGITGIENSIHILLWKEESQGDLESQK